MLPVRAASRKMSRSLLSLLKNWLGPMPMANSVVPGSLAKCRASDSTAAAGAQVSSSTVFGIEVGRVLLDQVEDRPAADLLAVGQRDLDRAFQQGVADLRFVADLVAGERLRGLGRLVPPDVVAPLLAQRLGDEHVASACRGGGSFSPSASTWVWFVSSAGFAPKTSAARRYFSVSMRTRIGRSVHWRTYSAS